MSDDELEKLAAAMKNVKPSKAARETGMAAAMAAFDAEFADETVTQTEAVEENISQPNQGLASAPHPTGQDTLTGRVQTLGRDTMSKFSGLFSFKPKTAMMMGSCAVALFATSLYIPNMTFEDIAAKSAPEAVTVKVGADDVELGAVKAAESKIDEVDTIVVTGKKAASPEPVEQEKLSEVEIIELDDAMPKRKGGINSISDLLDQVRSDSAKTESEIRDREAKFRQHRDEQAGLLARPTIRLGDVASADAKTSRAVAEYRAVLQQKDNIALFVAPQDIFTKAAAAEAAKQARTNQSINTQQVGGYTLEEVPAEYKTVTEDVVVQEASTELVTIPATFETVTETIVVQPQSVEYVAVPPIYEWVDGDVEGNSVEYVTIPAQYETVQESVVVQEASSELVTIPATFMTVSETVVVQPQYVAQDGSLVPAVTKQQSRRVVKTPASTQERTIPAVTKMETRRVVKTPASTVERIVPYEKRDGKTRVPVTEAKVTERTVPAVTKTVSRRVVKTPARTQERVKPNIPSQVTRQVLVSQPKFYLRDDDGKIVREFESRDAFESYKAHLTTSVEETPVSTFSIDVDSASYSFMRSSLNRGQLPPRSSIRLEEMINYFPYDYEAPTSADEPFKANVTVTSNPWNAETKLMHIGIKGYVPEAQERPRSNIVFLIDTSGSMNLANKLPLLISSFKLLVGTLDENDTVSIVTYAGRAGTVLEPTPASDTQAINDALTRLRAGGSTAGAAGLELAYNKALESFEEDGNNRVILATDGDFNVGFSSHEEMKTFIEKKRKTGIFLSVLGFGRGNYNDQLMQSLAQNGNGVAAYIDNLAEANKVLANEAGSALITIAKDVKIQVEFNPETISEYRLIGYETRALKREDFNNDKVDAGEIGAGHSVTAIYEMTPVGSPAISNDPLRYIQDKVRSNTTESDEFAFVKIRHKLPSSDTSTLQTFPIGKSQERKLSRASDDMRFAAAVAAVGQKLRGDTQLDDFSYEDAIALASGAKGEDKNGYRSEFIQLVRLAKGLEK